MERPIRDAKESEAAQAKNSQIIEGHPKPQREYFPKKKEIRRYCAQWHPFPSDLLCLTAVASEPFPGIPQ